MKHIIDRLLSEYDGMDWLSQRKARTLFMLNLAVILLLAIEIIVSSLLLGRIAPESFSNILFIFGLAVAMYPLLRGRYNTASVLGIFVAFAGISWTRYASTGLFSSDLSYDIIQYVLDLILILFYANLIVYRRLIIIVTFVCSIIFLAFYAYHLSNISGAVFSSAALSVLFSGFVVLLLAGIISLYTFLQNQQAIDIADKESRVTRESERNYREIFNSTNEAIFVHDASTGRILDVNDRMLSMFGFETKEEVLHQSIEMLSAGVPPYTGSEAQQFLFNAKMLGEQTFEWLAQNTSGKQFWVEVSLHKSDIGGKERILAVVRDISERKQAEESLRLSESQFRELWGATLEGIVIHDMGTILEVNDAACNIFGITRELVIGTSLFDFSPVDDRQRIINHFSTDSGERFETSALRADGKKLILEIFAKQIRFRGIVARMAALRDITERKEAEEALRISEERFRLILENMPILLNAFDENGNIISWNKSCEAVTGYGADEIIGNPKAFELLYPDPEYRLKVWNSSLNPNYKNNVYDLVTKNGQVRTVEWFDIYHTLKIPGWASWGMGIDITERNRSEEALREREKNFRLLFEYSPLGIYVASTDGNIIDGNSALLGILGSPSLEATQQINVLSFPPLIQNGYTEKFRECIETKKVIFIELRYTSKWGKSIYLSSYLVPLTNAVGTVEKVYTIMMDITGKKDAEDALKNLNETLEQRVAQRTGQLENAYKEMESFSYSISHDLRAPLRAIDGYTKMFADHHFDLLDDEGKRLFGNIRSQTQKMDLLINDILTLSRLSRSEIRLSPIDMTGLTRSIFSEVTTADKRNRIVLHVDNLPVAFADPSLIHQVLFNLISNAVKFSSKKENPTIEISGRESGTESVYTIRDNGAGFDMRYIDKMFGIFQRLHKVQEFEGTGVGLAIVQRLISRHGGKVWAEGEIGNGAAFHFTLPRKSE